MKLQQWAQDWFAACQALFCPAAWRLQKMVEAQLRTLHILQVVDIRCNPNRLLFATPDGRPVEANVLLGRLALLERRAYPI